MDEFVIKRRDKEEGSADRYKTIPDISKYGAITITKDKFITAMPKPKEFINCTNELIHKLMSMVHMNNGVLLADIFAAGTIPCNNILFEDIDFVDIDNSPWTITAHVFVCDNPEIIIESLNGKDDITTIGIIRMTAFNIHNPEQYERCDMVIRLRYDWNIDWFPLLSFTEHDFDEYRVNDRYNRALSYMVIVRDEIFLAWYGLQLALLNPVIKERIHRETVPMDEVKAGNNKKKKAKTVKRYVKRITVDDLSDIEIATDPKRHNMTKSYWWVTGHWRNQKTKDGHIRKFIKGYWKGPMREIADELGYEPYERKIVLEES